MRMMMIELSGNGTCWHEILFAGVVKMKWVWDSNFGWLCNTTLRPESTVWRHSQTAEHDPSISTKGWRGPWRAFGALQIPSSTLASAHSRVQAWHFASKQAPCTEAAREGPVALIAQEIFPVYLIFEHRQNLPGRRAHCICRFCLCKPMGISALALLVAKICKGPSFREASVYVQC